MENLRIRLATVADVPRILVLYQSSGIESATPFSADEAQAHFAVFDRYPDFHVFVAEIDGEIAGTYELLVMDNLAKHGRRSGIVEDVAVAPEYQGRGIGRALMEHACARCREAGCYKLMLSSNIARTKAHAFYESLGFERHGISFRLNLD